MVLVHSERTVAVLGAGPLATAVAARLQADGLNPTVLGPLGSRTIDRRSLRRARTLVVLATHSDVEVAMRLPRTERIARMRGALELALSRVRRGARLVFVTSAAICGTRPTGGMISDDDPPTSDPGFGLVDELLQMRSPLDAPGVPGVPSSVAELRLAALTGPGVDTVVTRHFEAPRLLQVLGGEMRWQFVHLEDAADAVAFVLAHRLTGVMTVGCEGEIDMDRVCELTGMRTLTLPRTSAFEAAEKLASVGMIAAPVADLSVVVDPWPVTSQALTAAGWRPRYTNEDCLGAMMAENHRRPMPRRAGAVRAGALSAGAAIAAFSTAALVKRSRRH